MITVSSVEATAASTILTSFSAAGGGLSISTIPGSLTQMTGSVSQMRSVGFRVPHMELVGCCSQQVADLMNEMFGSKALARNLCQIPRCRCLVHFILHFLSLFVCLTLTPPSLFRFFTSSSLCSLWHWSWCWSSSIARANPSVLPEYLLSSVMCDCFPGPN